MNDLAQKGFTLFELVMVMILTAIIAGVASVILTSGFKAYFSGQALGSISSQSSMAMQRLFKELKNAISIDNASASAISFTGADGNTVSYSVSGSTLNRAENGGAAYPLSTQVAGINFSYYNDNLLATATLSQISAVTMQLTIAGSEHQFALINTVYLENLP